MKPFALHHLTAKILICAALACQTPKKTSLPLLVAGQFDAATTYYAAGSSPYLRESNPIYRPFAGNPSAFVVMVAADSAALYASGKILRNHPRIRCALIYAILAVHVAGGCRNLALLGKHP